jgi:plastocyanin
MRKLLALLLLAVYLPLSAKTLIVQVGGSNLVFTPQFTTIHVGDTVTFVNVAGQHNVVSDDQMLFRCARGCDGDGKGGNGAPSSSSWVASVTFSQARKIGYFCEVHGAPGEGMYGSIDVMGNATGPASGTTMVPSVGAFALAVMILAIVLTALIALPRFVLKRIRDSSS